MATLPAGDVAMTATTTEEMFPPNVDLEDDVTRFIVELEFVHTLGNPKYLGDLAAAGYMRDPAFVNYLKYLLYWKTQPYVKYITSPFCLFYLTRLQSEQFREKCADRMMIELMIHQQESHRIDCEQNIHMLNDPDIVTFP